MQLYLMRHGETNYNVLGLCNEDPTRDVHLTARGREQAEAAAERLRGVPLHRIVITELPRTRETAEIVNRYHGVPLETHAELNDILTGFDGRPVAEYHAAIAHDRLRARPPGGESLLEHKRRVLRFLDWLQSQTDAALLAVTHEEPLRVLVGHFRGIADAELPRLSFANAEVLHFSL